MKTRVLTWVALLGLGAVLGGCRSDCGVWCDKRKECFSADLDVEQCTDECVDWAKEDQARQERAAECADCVGQRTCAEVLQSCIDDCLGVP